ncbi:MAG: alpha-glucan phosphorylase [Chloroflexi bacterium HGW-Chloroflexi-10]|nr:MAG: alpha-glucan phosphorylase [Chloroflexi bacterium HGW-Chloroflexi-10]
MEDFRRKIPVTFSLPRRIQRLGELSYNLWWVWNQDAQHLFKMIDKPLWDMVNHNPVAFLQQVQRPLLNKVVNDLYFLDRFDRVMDKFDQYISNPETWFNLTYPNLKNDLIAYFSFEFGLHESLPVYAGGLGILSGDHLKAASDLGMPMVAVGFVYKQGYFTQSITEDGWQETRNFYLNFSEIPIIPLLDEQGKPLMITIDLPGRKVYVRIWQVDVGRVQLYLLDSDLEENSPSDRQLTSRLYSNDLEVRISQEILLGVGGVRALRRLGFKPSVWHMNEGHSAFLVVERILEFIQSGMTYLEASRQVQKNNVFTTHTPVPAGNDQFPIWLIDKYFTQTWPQLGLTRDQFVELGRQAQSWGESFVMPVLALKLSEQRNAVSELHGEVSRKMWHWLWADHPEDEVPITHVTNGIHTGTWIARQMDDLFRKYMGQDWQMHVDDPELWLKIDEIPDEELWAVRRHLKRKLSISCNNRARKMWMRGGVHPVQVLASGVLMEPYSLTIGFARRFATYKRANLILRDYERMLSIVNNERMPVQIIFAGKAHPADEPGKLLIQQVYRAVKDARMGGRLIFLEDYDMNVARLLVQGVDVWMNTPRRPNEASGTSGMKAALNGVLNFSVLDGWWREGFNGKNGWPIGDETEYQDYNQQDEADSRELYDTLENEIVPLYYQSRSADNLPNEWIGRIKETIRTNGPLFSTHRMVKEYMNNLYRPAIEKNQKK